MWNKEALIEAVKELLRVVVLAIIPVIILGIENGELSLKTIGVVAGLAALRFVDKFLHEVGKSIEAEGTKRNPIESPLTGGLTRF